MEKNLERDRLVKKVRKLVVFYIKEFYPSIKKQLLKKAFEFANSYVNIPGGNKKIINHARKPLLNNKIWM